MTVNDVIQFNEGHKWCRCLGVITEERDDGYMIGVPIPDSGIAYIFDDGSSIEYIGKAVLVEDDNGQ